MKKMKFGIVVFPGSNCDRDMQYVLSDVLKQEVEMLWHKEADLKGCDFIILPGGFSYGDYLRSGAIARFSPIMEKVLAHANQGGFLMGICNGFQILCEAGLLPGALLHNNSHSFICKNVMIKAEHNKSKFTKHIPIGKALQIPIAHGEGRYFDHPEKIEHLEQNKQVLFRYCNEDATVNEAANPNGAVNNIAGICNAQGNVFGMMPHPERASDSLLNNTDGLSIFESILDLANA
jgi:phosphoribosylformylglycinamidine synthase subunit PurQ / glutaminase